MRALLALALVIAACDVTQLDVPPRDDGQEQFTGRWVSDWMVAGTNESGTYSTRYVFDIVENADGTCSGMLSCQCSDPNQNPPVPGNHFWEGDLSQNYLTMHSTNLVTGDAGDMTAALAAGLMNVTFSWGEALTFTRSGS